MSVGVVDPESGRRGVVLIGMPGAGKSTIGVLLARELAVDFVDTDLLIQVQQNQTLQAILDAQGFEALRRIEEAVLLDLQPGARVIATGGSAVYSDAGMAHLAQHTTIVFLDVPVEVLKQRLPDISARGIAAPPGTGLQGLAEERVPLYRQHADLVVSAGDGSAEDVVHAVISALSAETNG